MLDEEGGVRLIEEVMRVFTLRARTMNCCAKMVCSPFPSLVLVPPLHLPASVLSFPPFLSFSSSILSSKHLKIQFTAIQVQINKKTA